MATDAVIYRWYLDGTLLETTPGTSVELDGLAPGTHTLTATAVDDSGNESAASPGLVFTVGAAVAGGGRRMQTGKGT